MTLLPFPLAAYTCTWREARYLGVVHMGPAVHCTRSSPNGNGCPEITPSHCEGQGDYRRFPLQIFLIPALFIRFRRRTSCLRRVYSTNLFINKSYKWHSVLGKRNWNLNDPHFNIRDIIQLPLITFHVLFLYAYVWNIADIHLYAYVVHWLLTCASVPCLYNESFICVWTVPMVGRSNVDKTADNGLFSCPLLS